MQGNESLNNFWNGTNTSQEANYKGTGQMSSRGSYRQAYSLYETATNYKKENNKQQTSYGVNDTLNQTQSPYGTQQSQYGNYNQTYSNMGNYNQNPYNMSANNYQQQYGYGQQYNQYNTNSQQYNQLYGNTAPNYYQSVNASEELDLDSMLYEESSSIVDVDNIKGADVIPMPTQEEKSKKEKKKSYEENIEEMSDMNNMYENSYQTSYENSSQGTYEKEEYDTPSYALTPYGKRSSVEEYDDDVIDEDKKNIHSISVGEWLKTLFLATIPVVNIICLISWAFNKKDENKKTFSRAFLFWALAMITVTLVLMDVFFDSLGILQKFNIIKGKMPG